MRTTLVASALCLLAGAAPASAAPPIPAGGPETLRLGTRVAPGLVALPGGLDCAAGRPAQPGILWYTPGRTQATLWRGLAPSGGQIAHTDMALTIPTGAVPTVGDFDGDRCGDIAWLHRRTGRVTLMWGSPAGPVRGRTFTLASRPAQLVAVRTRSARFGLYAFRPGGRDSFHRPTGTRATPFATAPAPQIEGAGRVHALRTRDTDGPVLAFQPARAGLRTTLTRLRASRGGFVAAGRTLITLRRGTRIASCGNQLLAHLPGRGPDSAISITAAGRVHRNALAIPGGSTPSGSADTADGCVVVWSVPASPSRTIWLPAPSPGAPTTPGGGGGGGNGPTIPSAHPRIYLTAANRSRLTGLIAAGAPSATRLRALVDAAVGGANPYGYEAWNSALLGQLTGEPRYCAHAVGLVNRFVTAEEALIAQGLRPTVAGDSYLEVGPLVGDLAMTYDWCHATIDQATRQRWIAYANQAVWNVWHHEQAQWGGVASPWSGWSVDNPSNNYYYSFLRATMLLGVATNGENASAETWLTTFRTAKIQNQLVPTFAADLTGGGSREGTGYGTAMKGLFALYDLWESSTGESIDDLTPHARESMAYLMHATVPTRDRLAPIGDHARDSTAALFDYHREYGLALAHLNRSDPLAGPMREWLATSSVPQMSQGFERVYDFLYDDPAATRVPLASLATAYFGSGTGHLFTRSSWDTDATWLGFNMGPYTESHAHQDQLSLLVFNDSLQAYDANVESHSGIVQDTRAHNLVRIERAGTVVPQREGGRASVLALADTAAFTYAAADATAVYGATSGVVNAQREIVYLKPDVVVVYDRVDAGAGSNLVWQLNAPRAPVVSGATTTFGGADDLVMRPIAPAGASATTVALAPSFDGEAFAGGYRRELAVPAGGQVEFLTVLSVDGAVSDAVASNTVGADGVRITLAGGGEALVRFNQASSGGSLTLSGAHTYDGPLPQTVATLPLLAG